MEGLGRGLKWVYLCTVTTSARIEAGFGPCGVRKPCEPVEAEPAKPNLDRQRYLRASSGEANPNPNSRRPPVLDEY